MAMGKSFRLYHRISPGTSSPYGVILEHRNKQETLLFDSQTVAVLSAEETRTIKPNYKRVSDAYGFLGILQINSGDANILYAVMITGCISVGKIGDSELFRITNTHFLSLRNNAYDEERIVELRKLLNSGTFYFSWSSVVGDPLDLTLCAQRRLKTNETDNRFFWNRMLYTHLLHYGVDCSQWLIKIMCGSIEMKTVYVGHQQAKACIVSRLSCERAGTRFNVRGCNDDGHVANFVETEQSIHLGDAVSSYLQTRGSVPLFWEQPGVQVGSHRVKMSRGVDASTTVFDRHLTLIKRRYGKQVIVNLLGSKEGESLLTEMFHNHLKTSKRHQDIPYIHFDYHALCRRTKNNDSMLLLRKKVDKYLTEFGVFTAFGSDVQCEQSGTIRTNCLDCLDRTNCVQTFIGLEMLGKQLYSLGVTEEKQVGRFEEVFRQMWINNGDQVSKIYAGTGALEGKSKLTDGARSMARTIQNNLLDSSKQEAIDILLLGSTFSNDFVDRARVLLPRNVLHAPNNMLQALCARHREYTRPVTLRISVATWNVNGGKNLHNVAFKHQPMDEWLLDAQQIARNNTLVDFEQQVDQRLTDIFAVGFEEIVDLNATNIMSSSTANQEEWRKAIHKCINRDQRYVLVTCQQLVGVCLFIFVRPELVPVIRDVAIDLVKTGLGGAAGNKGAVAIRMLVHCTSVCFVCAHFAAGQSQFADRNADYQEITKKLIFPMGRRLDSHDYVFWCGDFNYRIDLSIDDVKEAVKQKNWPLLVQHDQLVVQKNEGNCFADFVEGEIDFPPTYKYDTFSDDYDTSEKSRIPAWTDRVLWKRYDDKEKQPKLIFYGRGELKTSDHRPVIAILDIEVRQMNNEKRDAIFENVLKLSGPPDGTITVSSSDNPNFGEEEYLSKLLEILSGVGVVTLVRFVGESIWITFSDGRSALSALQLDGANVNGYPIRLSLKMSDWQQAIYRELQLCSDNTVPLTNEIQQLEEEEVIPSEALDDMIDTGFFNDDVSSEDGSSQSGKTSPNPPWDDGPSGQSAATAMTFVSYLDSNNTKQQTTKVPPPRPAPPQRPPPPQMTDVGLQRTANVELQQQNVLNDSSNHVNSDVYESISNSDEVNDYSSPPPPSIAPPPPPQLSEPTTPQAACRQLPPRLPDRPQSAPSQTNPSTIQQPPPIPARTKAAGDGPGVVAVAPSQQPSGPPVPARSNVPTSTVAAGPPTIPPRRQLSV